MNFLGVGGSELLLILIITMIVAGPRRMIAWSYQLGRWLSRAQKLWAESARVLQREFDEAGVEVEVPRQLPTRRTLNRELRKAVESAAAPIREPLQELRGEVKADLDGDLRALNEASQELNERLPAGRGTRALSEATKKRPASGPEQSAPPAAPGDDAADFGSWSDPGDRGEDGHHSDGRRSEEA